MVTCSTGFYCRQFREPFVFSFLSRVCFKRKKNSYNQLLLQITRDAAGLCDQVRFSRKQTRKWMMPRRYPSLSQTWALLLLVGPLFILVRLDFKQIQRSSSKVPNREHDKLMSYVCRARAAGTAAAGPQCPATVLHLSPGRPTAQDERIIHSL